MPAGRRPVPARSAAALAAVIACGAVLSARAGWRELQRTAPPPPVVSPAATLESDAVVAVSDTEDTSAAAAAFVPPVPAAGGAPAEPAGPDAQEGDAAPEEPGAPASRALTQFTKRDLDIRVEGLEGEKFPLEVHLPEETFEPRRFATTTFTWKAAGYCHKPLYFEHWNLERYGHSHGFAADSFLSAVHFFARIPALPYQMGVELPWECVYPLGYYRPGSCAPWTVPAVPVSARGFAVGAATATGIVFLLP